MGVYRRDKIWYIDYRDQLGKRYREAVGTHKRVAEQALAKRKTEIAENRFLDKKKIDRIGLDVAADEFIELHSKERKRSWQRDVQMVRHLKDYFNGDRLGDISPLDIEKYMATRIKLVKPATVNREVACLKAIFNKQIYWGGATVNPVKGVKFYQENNQIDRYLSKSEIPRLMKECSGNLRSIVIIALNTGMRLSEILNLRWKDIALKPKIIYIIKSKNGERRNIPISTPIAMWLRELKDEATGDYVLDNQGHPLTKRRRGVRIGKEPVLKTGER